MRRTTHNGRHSIPVIVNATNNTHGAAPINILEHTLVLQMFLNGPVRNHPDYLQKLAKNLTPFAGQEALPVNTVKLIERGVQILAAYAPNLLHPCFAQTAVNSQATATLTIPVLPEPKLNPPIATVMASEPVIDPRIDYRQYEGANTRLDAYYPKKATQILLRNDDTPHGYAVCVGYFAGRLKRNIDKNARFHVSAKSQFINLGFDYVLACLYHNTDVSALYYKDLEIKKLGLESERIKLQRIAVNVLLAAKGRAPLCDQKQIEQDLKFIKANIGRFSSDKIEHIYNRIIHFGFGDLAAGRFYDFVTSKPFTPRNGKARHDPQ